MRVDVTMNSTSGGPPVTGVDFASRLGGVRERTIPTIARMRAFADQQACRSNLVRCPSKW